jgi:hypothetical protein
LVKRSVGAHQPEYFMGGAKERDVMRVTGAAVRGRLCAQLQDDWGPHGDSLDNRHCVHPMGAVTSITEWSSGPSTQPNHTIRLGTDCFTGPIMNYSDSANHRLIMQLNRTYLIAQQLTV